MWVRSLGWEDPLEKEMATHSSILTWEILQTEEPGGQQSVESQNRLDLATKQQQSIERMVSQGKKHVRGQLTLLCLSSQCTAVITVSISVSDYTLQKSCLPVNQRADYAANPPRMVCVNTANLASCGVPRHQAPNRGTQYLVKIIQKIIRFLKSLCFSSWDKFAVGEIFKYRLKLLISEDNIWV